MSAIHTEATLWTFYPHRLRESSVLDDLLDENTRLTIKDLSKDKEDDKTCSICQIDYQENYANLVEGKKTCDAGELPIKLPRCGHVFGHDCLRRWATNNTCPLCRESLLYSTEVIPGVIDIDMRDCALIADLDYAGRLYRLLREFEEVPGPLGPVDLSHLVTQLDHHAGNFNLPLRRWVGGDIPVGGHEASTPALSLLERRGRERLRITTVPPRRTALAARRPSIPQSLWIIPPGDWIEDNASVRGLEAHNPVPTHPERRVREPLHINDDVQRHATSTHAPLPPSPVRSPIRRRERYIPLSLVEPQHRPRHRTSRIEYRLYTWLLGHGINLPSPLDPRPATNENEELTPRQEQALFEYIQSQGAFHYPRMDPWFQNPYLSSDRDVYEQLRRLGLFWQPCGAWGRRDGSLAFVSEELTARLRGQRERDEARESGPQAPELRLQLQPPIGIEAQEPTLEVEVQRPIGPQKRRSCFFRQVRDRLSRRDAQSGNLTADHQALPRWLRFGQSRRLLARL